MIAGLVDRLAEVVGAANVSAEPVVLDAYARDAYPLSIKAALGRPGTAGGPHVVTRPGDTDEVAAIVRICDAAGVPVVAYGGGSGICGSALATEGGVVVDCKRLSRVEELDRESGTVTVGAGILGGELERQLNAVDLTCGHSPQSLYSSTVGGWIAHRGAGTFSTRYGKVDDLLVAIEVVLPSGDVLHTRDVPASAAGPDLSALFLGSEGTLGIITRATLKVFARPAYQAHASWAVSDMAGGLDLARRVLQAGYRPAVVRLYDAVETSHLFGSLSLPTGRCVLLILDQGDPPLVDLTMARVGELARAAGAEDLGEAVGEHWLRSRFSTAGLMSTLDDERGIADALEVANSYRRLPDTYRAMTDALFEAARELDLTGIEVFGHGSHFYHTGANLYMIFHAFGRTGYEVAKAYPVLVQRALAACLATGGSLTHHHGVGLTKAVLMGQEWGPAGIDLWRSIKRAVDPAGLMNPGNKVISHAG